MTQVVLDAIAPSAVAPLDSAGAKPDAAAPGADLFRATLADQLQLAAPAAKPTAATADASSADGAQQALEAKITTMLKAGASPADVITTLAAKLAASVSANLGDDGSDARAKLQAMFAAALAPPGTNDDAGGSAADRARILAQRYVRIATLATSITGLDNGQQKRITGTVLDAQRAKDIPARTKTTATKTAQPSAVSPAAGTSAANAVAASTPSSVSGTIVPVGIAGTAGALTQPIPATLGDAATIVKRLHLPAAHVNVGETMGISSDRSALHATSSAGDPAVIGAARPLASIREIPLAPAVPASAAIATPNALTGLPVIAPPAVIAAPAPAAVGAPAAIAASSTPVAIAPPAATPIASAAQTPNATPIASAVQTPNATPIVTAVAVNRILDASSSLPDTSSLTSAGVASLPVATASLSQDPANAKSAANKRVSGTSTKSDATASAAGILGRAGGANAGVASAVPSSPASPESSANAGNDAGRVPLNGAALTADSALGDGRTVDLGSTAGTQTGGDTSLGRTLVRAALVADSNPVAITDGTSPVEPASSAPSNDVAPDTAVSAFVKAFEVALNAGTVSDTERSAQHDVPASSLALPVHGTADSASAFVPAVAPFTIDRAASTSAAAPAAPAVPVDHSAIADQVLRGAFMRNVGESSEIRLSLVPDSLGDVSVKLVVDAGNVTAHVVAQTSDVRDALVAAQPQLTKSLADSGLKLTSFTVDLQGSGFAGFSQQQNDGSQSGNRSRRLANSADVDGASDETLLEAIPSFGPASVPKPGTGAYNYLA